MKQRSVVTQFGPLTVTDEAGAITRLSWGAADHQVSSPLLDQAVDQIRRFDAGELSAFNLPLRVEGNGFLRAVCDVILAIPFGETCTYGDIAKKLGASAQSVGQACGQNPIPVIIPCHRVMGAKGLTGYSGAGGIETKIALLRHEGAAGLLI